MKDKAKWGRRVALGLCAIAIAALLVWPQSKQPSETQDTPVQTQTADIHARRETAYQKDMATLTALTKQGDADENTRRDAAQQLAQLTQEHQTELALLSALSANGYEQSVVIARGGGVTITVDRERLTNEDTAFILSLCLHHTQLEPASIRIMTGSLE